MIQTAAGSSLSVFRILLPAILVVTLFSVTGADAQIPKIYSEMPGFTLPALGGGEKSLSDFRGGSAVVLVTYRGWVGYW